jgi:hypothetical protein
MSDHVDIPPNNDGGIDLETLVDALAENKEIGQPSEYYPSSGRVLEDSVDGTIYLGDGDQWLTVSTDSSLSTPAVDAENLDNTETVLIGSGGKYSNLQSAFADITDASASKRYRLLIIDNTDEPSQINAKSHIDVVSLGGNIILDSDSQEHAVHVDGLTDATWRDVTVRRRGTPPRNSNALLDAGSTDDTVEFVNCRWLNETTGDDSCVGARLAGGTQSVHRECTAIGGDGGGNCYGYFIRERAASTLQSPYAKGGGYNQDDKTDNTGINIIQAASPTITDPTARGGGEERSDGIDAQGTATPTINGGVGVAGRGAASTGLKLGGSAAPEVTGFTSRPRQHSVKYNYENTGDESFTPISGHPYYVHSVYVEVDTAGSDGSTVDIGTSNGASDIAADVPIDSEGSADTDITQQPQSADSDIHISNVDDTSAEFRVYVVVRDNNNINGLRLQTDGHAELTGCEFIASYGNRCAEFNDEAVNDDNWQISNSRFVCPDPSNRVLRNSNVSAILPIRDSSFQGRFDDGLFPRGQLVSVVLMRNDSKTPGTTFEPYGQDSTTVDMQRAEVLQGRIVFSGSGSESGDKTINARQLADNTDLELTISGTNDQTRVTSGWVGMYPDTEGDNIFLPRLKGATPSDTITVERFEVQLFVQ